MKQRMFIPVISPSRFDGPNAAPGPGDPMYGNRFPGGQQMGARPNGPQDQFGGNFQRPYPGQGQYGKSLIR